jgi:hypothetical protein
MAEGKCTVQIDCSPFLAFESEPGIGSSGIAPCCSARLLYVDSSALGTARILQREREEMWLIAPHQVKEENPRLNQLEG